MQSVSPSSSFVSNLMKSELVVSCKIKINNCLPDKVGQLYDALQPLNSNIQSLNLVGYHLRKLPLSIQNLQGLEFLYLENNDLGGLPGTMRKISSLQLIDLTGNLITKIDETLYQLPATCSVILNNNPIINSPKSLEDLTQRTRDVNYSGPVFHIGMQRFPATKPEDNLDQTNTSTLKQFLSPMLYAEAKKILSVEVLKNLGTLISRYQYRSKDISENYDRSIFKQMIEWYLHLEDKTLQSECSVIIENSISTCVNQIGYCLNLLKLKKLMRELQEGKFSEEELRSLCLEIEKMREIEEISHKTLRQIEKNIREEAQEAIEKVNQSTNREVEELAQKADLAIQEINKKTKKKIKNISQVELFLEIQISLKERLNIHSFIADKMDLFRGLSPLGKDQLEKLCAAAEAELSGPENEIKLLCRNPEWQKHISGLPTFEQQKKRCEDDKQEFLELIPDGEWENYNDVFKKHDQTIWNPYYFLTHLHFSKSPAIT